MITGASRTLTDGCSSILPWQEHIRQSIGDILSTPIGTRTMRPAYGSRVPRLIDRPIDQSWKLEVYVAATEALHRWEPRIRVKQVRIPAAGNGYIEIEVDFELVETGERGSAGARVER
jgi:Phage baseplate assembly protein W